MGHLGSERTLNLIRDRFYWPKMPNRQTRAPMQSIETTRPFQLVSTDFLHLEQCKGGCEYILVVVDHYTCFARAYATTNIAAKTVADRLLNDFCLSFGFPEKLHHDLGPEFKNRLLHHLKELSGMKGSHTSTQYHLQGNGQTERFNQTLLSMLRTLTEEQKSDWKSYLPKVAHACNCAVNEATGYSPFFLFGRLPRLPVDLLFGIKREDSPRPYQDNVDSWRQIMNEAYSIASRNAAKSASRGKTQYDKKKFTAHRYK